MENDWSLKEPIVIKGTDICQCGIPHTNRSIVTHLNRYERLLNHYDEKEKRIQDKIKNRIKDLNEIDFMKYESVISTNELKWVLSLFEWEEC